VRLVLVAALGAAICAPGCSVGTGGVGPPPPPSIAVSISPLAGTVLVGNQLTFTATVTNTADTSVSWSVNGIVGGNSSVGTITANGAYTAPADLPAPATAQITATSHADATKSSSATVTITSDLALSLNPNTASVELGAGQSFQVTVTSAGHPDTAMRWSLSGGACPTACGTVDSSGLFTAPRILPSPTSATVTAQSVADPSKQISATVSITSSFALQLSAPSNVPAGSNATVSLHTHASYQFQPQHRAVLVA